MTTRDASRETKRERANFSKVRRAEVQYSLRLRKIARHVGELVRSFAPLDPTTVPEIMAALSRYADTITPWARATAAAMIADVSRRDERVWSDLADEMGRALRHEIRREPTGARFRVLQAEQVALITSLPTEAAQRVHRLATEARIKGVRASEIVDEILRTGEVTVSRANTIARTEVGRVATNLAQARSESVGSDGYIWRTVRDSDVRPSHKKMEGKFVRWSAPPTLDGLVGHAGTTPNCRCYPEIVLPRL